MEPVGLLDQLLASRLGRCVADALFRRRARRRLLTLDRLQPARAQLHVLQRLINQAQRTIFACDHDFARLRTEHDFRRLVPLRTSAELWRLYSDALTHGDATWPGPIHHLATCESPASPLIVTGELIQSHRTALLTALALAVHVRPHTRLLSGTLLFVGGGAALTPLRGAPSANLEELTRSELPALLRPYTAVAPYSGDGSLHELSARAALLSVTCLVGNTRRLARLAALLQEQKGHSSLRAAWPMLQVVLYSRSSTDPTREELAELIGDRRVLIMEACARPEGVVAIEDPRHGLLRLLPDHGVYFEFVPVDELGRSQPRRLGLAEVNAGTPYALAVTSSAGLWACLVGLTVCFERLDPPLLRSVEVGLPAATPNEILPLRTDSPGRVAPPHPQIGDTQAGPARRFARSPWSARADQK